MKIHLGNESSQKLGGGFTFLSKYFLYPVLLWLPEN